MTYEMFLQEVRHRTGLTSNLESVDAARAVLQTFFECLPGVLACEVASHLPCALRSDFRYREQNPGERLTVTEFLLRVAEREGVTETTAFCHTQAIFQMLGASLGYTLLERVRTQMPSAFDEFWGADPAHVHMHQPVV